MYDGESTHGEGATHFEVRDAITRSLVSLAYLSKEIAFQILGELKGRSLPNDDSLVSQITVICSRKTPIQDVQFGEA